MVAWLYPLQVPVTSTWMAVAVPITWVRWQPFAHLPLCAAFLFCEWAVEYFLHKEDTRKLKCTEQNLQAICICQT